MDKNILIQSLNDTHKSTLSYFNLPDHQLSRKMAPGKWSVRYLLLHITDAETVLYDRIRRIIANPNQVIWAFNQDAWAQNIGYQNFPLEISQQIYSSVRKAVIYLADQHYDTLGENEFVHNETGKRTLKDEFQKIAWHNQHHLSQISSILT